MPRPPNIDAQLAKLEARFAREKKRLMLKKSGPLLQRQRALRSELTQVERELARLGVGGAPRLGRPPAGESAAPRETGGVKRRRRLNKEAKMKLAQAIYDQVRSKKGTRYRAGELNNLADGLPVPQLIGLWNKANKQTQISSEGKRSKMRYFVD